MSGACRRELDIRAAVRSGAWSPGLREHVSSCDECAAAASVSACMTALAREDARQHVLPDPKLIWLKGQLLQGTRELARVSRPLSAYQLAAHVIVAAGWSAILMWKWSALLQWLHQFSIANVLIGVSAGSPRATIPFPFLLTVLLLASITALVAVHAILAEE